jgi:integrating conjugative element protein (TIGR03749 family)
MHAHPHPRRCALLSSTAATLSLLSVTVALAQDVVDIQPAKAQPALIDLAAPSAVAPTVADFNLGQPVADLTTAPEPKAQGVARRAAAAAAAQPNAASKPTGPAANVAKGAVRSGVSGVKGGVPPGPRSKDPSDTSPDRPGIERAVFARQPVRVGLPVMRERLITLPGPAALHVPADIEAVARIEAIDRTIYVTALVPFAPIRIVAELIEGGQQIPLDLVANNQTHAASAELEVFLDKTPSRTAAATTQGPAAEGPPAADMVELTRFASRMLYAPRRLATARQGIQQVRVSTKPVPGLVRGGLVEAVPLGQWRSAGLYVTAVRVTNKSAMPFELPLEHLRGRWIAVTAQHGRIGPAGSETDTTALYLVCDRAFEACL